MGTATSGAQVDITNTTGTVSIGASSANTLTLYTTVTAGTVGTDANVGEVKNTGAGTIVINSAVTENIKNTGTVADAGDQTALVVTLPLFSSSSTGSITVNGNVTFNNTNVIGSTSSTNQVAHTVTLSNTGAGTVAIAGSITTPASGLAWATPANVFINVKLVNTGGGAFTTRSAALRGAAGTTGITNGTAAGTMTLGQVGDTFTASWDIVNDIVGSTLTLNGTGTLAGALTNGATSASAVVLGANQTISGIVTVTTGTIRLNANTLTLSGTGAGVLVNSGDIFSAASGATGSGWVKFTGAAPTMTGTGAMPNVEVANATSFASASGNVYWGEFKTSGAGTVTIGGTSDIKGNLTVNGAGTITINDAGNAATTVRGQVNMNLGNITLGTAGLTVTGTFNMSAGTFTFATHTLTLIGNFNRTGGTIDAAAAGTGTLAFAGTTSQTFTPGTQMNVYNVTVTNTGNYLLNVVTDDIVTINASLIVLNNFTITTGQVALGTANIRMAQTGAVSARFTNNGRGYTSTGIGGIIFEGVGTNTGAAADGCVITGSQPFSNIYVRLSTPANNVYCLGAVVISGTVTLDGGGIIWNAATEAGDAFTASTLTLNQSLTGTAYPTVVINTVNTHGSPFLVDGADGGAVALAITTLYNLTYSGSSAATLTATDFVTAKVNNFSLVQGTGKTIQVLAGPIAIAGNLNVDPLETLNLANIGARVLTASGNTAVHTVNGTVTGGTLAITGNAATLTGGVGTGNVSSVATLTVTNASGTFTSTGMKVLGDVTINGAALVSNITLNSATATLTTFTNTAGTTTLNLNSTAVSAGGNYTVTAGSVNLTMNGAAAGTATIGGTLNVNGGTLILGSHVWVTGAVTHDGTSVIALGNFNLTPGAAYTHNNTATFTAGTGKLISTGAGVINYTFTTTVSIPNWTVNSAGTITFVTAGATVSGIFTHTLGAIDLNSLPLTISGNTYTYTAGTYANTGTAATGVVNLTGTALNITSSGTPSYEYLNVNSDAGTVTFKSNNATARTFTVTKTFTHTKGNIVLEINDLVLGDNGAANAQYTVVSTAGTVTGTATGANLGEVAFTGNIAAVQNLSLGADYSIQNLRIANFAHTSVSKVGTASKILTVGSNFGLGDDFTFLTTSTLVLGAGCTITRTNGVFDVVPTFGTTTNVVYSAALNTGKELPATGLNDLTIDGAVVFATSAGSPTVNGTLYMTSGTIDLTTNSKVLTLASGATINRSAGGWLAGTDAPTVTSYKLIYSGAAAPLTPAAELISTSCTDLTVSMTGGGVTLTSSKTVGNFSMSPTGAGAATVYFGVGADNALITFTTTGTTTINAGIVSTMDAAAANTSASTFGVNGSLVVNGGSFGVLGTDNGAGADGGLNVTFGGAVAQSVTLNGATTIPNITLSSTGTTAANSIINVTGGNLTITNLLTFTNGILNMGSNTLYLPRPTGAANGGLAFDRSAVTVGKFGNVVGKISRPANSNDGAGATNGRFEFPSGTSTGEYRPTAITFTPAYVVNNPVSIEVNHIASTPGGTVGLPLNGGNGITIGNYAPFYWLVNTTPTSLSSTQNFDIEFQANNIGVPYTSDQSLRIVRRQDGSATTNGWSMQGTAANYANYQVVTGVDTTVVARTTSSQGGLVAQGSRFAIGVPSRVPSFNAPAVPTSTVAEGATAIIQFTAVGLNSNDGTVTYSKISGPTWASLNTTTGLVTLTPGYTDYSATPYTLVIRATTATALTADKTVTITVTNTDQLSTWATATTTVNAATATTSTGVAKTITYSATDPDAGDVVTYEYTVTPAVSAGSVVFSATAGTLAFTPAFADVANSPFTFVVRAKSGTPAVYAATNITTVFSVTNTYAKGDVNKSGGVTNADAVLVLNYLVDPVTYPLTAEQLWLADCDANGVGNGTVTAYDAASILRKSLPVGGAFLPKTVAAAGTVSFGKFSSDKGTFTLPITLENTMGVSSVYSEIQLGSAVEFTGVQGRLPEGWLMSSKYENGTLKIAMAGLTPLSAGDVALVNLSLKDKDAKANVTGSVMLNDQIGSSLSAQIKEIPNDFSVSQNYPNPFNPTTSIKYGIPQNARVNLTVFNILGQSVRTLVNAEQESGNYTVIWDGRNDFGGQVSSGIYLYRISAGSFSHTVKMNLLK